MEKKHPSEDELQLALGAACRISGKKSRYRNVTNRRSLKTPATCSAERKGIHVICNNSTKPRCRDSCGVVRKWKRRAKTSPFRQTSHPCQGLCWDTARDVPSLPMSSAKPHGECQRPRSPDHQGREYDSRSLNQHRCQLQRDGAAVNRSRTSRRRWIAGGSWWCLGGPCG